MLLNKKYKYVQRQNKKFVHEVNSHLSAAPKILDIQLGEVQYLNLPLLVGNVYRL